MAHPLNLTLTRQNGPALTYSPMRTHLTVISERPLVPDQVFLVTDQAPPFQEWYSALTFDHVETNPIVTLEWMNTHI